MTRSTLKPQRAFTIDADAWAPLKQSDNILLIPLPWIKPTKKQTTPSRRPLMRGRHPHTGATQPEPTTPLHHGLRLNLPAQNKRGMHVLPHFKSEELLKHPHAPHIKHSVKHTPHALHHVAHNRKADEHPHPIETDRQQALAKALKDQEAMWEATRKLVEQMHDAVKDHAKHLEKKWEAESMLVVAGHHWHDQAVKARKISTCQWQMANELCLKHLRNILKDAGHAILMDVLQIIIHDKTAHQENIPKETPEQTFEVLFEINGMLTPESNVLLLKIVNHVIHPQAKAQDVLAISEILFYAVPEQTPLFDKCNLPTQQGIVKRLSQYAEGFDPEGALQTEAAAAHDKHTLRKVVFRVLHTIIEHTEHQATQLAHHTKAHLLPKHMPKKWQALRHHLKSHWHDAADAVKSHMPTRHTSRR